MKTLMTVCAIASLIVVGCGGGDDGPTLHKVTGKLTKGGSPLKGVIVEFHPTDKDNPICVGTTGEDGTFTLGTRSGKDGATAGSHKVVLVMDAGAAGDGENPYGKDGGAAPKEPEAVFPAEYKSADTSPKTVEVKEGGGDFPIEL